MERLSFAPLLKSVHSKFKGLFLDLQFYFILSVFMPVLLDLECCNLIVSFDLGWCKLSSFSKLFWQL